MCKAPSKVLLKIQDESDIDPFLKNSTFLQEKIINNNVRNSE